MAEKDFGEVLEVGFGIWLLNFFVLLAGKKNKTPMMIGVLELSDRFSGADDGACRCVCDYYSGFVC